MTRRHLPVLRNDAAPADATPTTSDPASSFDGIGAVRRVNPNAKKNAPQRSVTIAVARISKRELERGRKLYPESEYAKPQKRDDCLNGALSMRPCPFVSCSQHLYLEVNEDNGNIKLNFPTLEVWELRETCALDVADRGGRPHAELAKILGITRYYSGLIEKKIARKLRRLADLGEFGDWADLDRNAGSKRRKKVVAKRKPDGDAQEVPSGVRADVLPSSVLDDDNSSWCR